MSALLHYNLPRQPPGMTLLLLVVGHVDKLSGTDTLQQDYIPNQPNPNI